MIEDIVGRRVTCNTVLDAYNAFDRIKADVNDLGSRVQRLSAQWQDRQADYVFGSPGPKLTGYRGLHLTVGIWVKLESEKPHLVPCEIQIRDEEVEVVKVGQRHLPMMRIFQSPHELLPRSEFGEAFRETFERNLDVSADELDRIQDHARLCVESPSELRRALRDSFAAVRRREGELEFSDYHRVLASLYLSADRGNLLDEPVADLERSARDRISEDKFAERHPMGTVVKGRVERVEPSFAIVRLPHGASGVLPARFMRRPRSPRIDVRDYLKEGNRVDVEIVSSKARRVTLSFPDRM